MQVTRQHILEILKEHSEATIEQLAQELDLTSVTIRHHLDILRGEGLVQVPQVRRRTTPGRPQYVYTLTEEAGSFFPKNYAGLANLMISEIRDRLDPVELDRIVRGMANRVATGAPKPLDGETFEQRLERVASFLDGQGYFAKWEKADDGYYLHASNCPYRDVSINHSQVCAMDMTLVSELLSAAAERISWISAGENRCSYRIPFQAVPQ